MRRRVHLLVDMQDAAIEADEEGPPGREGLVVIDDAVGSGHCLGRIAQQRIVQAKLLREGLVGFGCVDADRKMRDVETPDVVAALTE